MAIGGVEGTGWRRDKLGLGVWDGQGKVAIVGWGNSPVDRRWDGVSMDKTYGAYALIAIKQALEDAGVKPEEVDDDAAAKLAFDMASKIEDELDYPGEVKVSVVRETRSVGIAK